MKNTLIIYFTFIFSLNIFSQSTYTVNSNADAGLGTLRTAINSANAAPDHDTIIFNLPTGQNNIVLSSDLEVTNPITIDGFYQTNKNVQLSGLGSLKINSNGGLATDPYIVKNIDFVGNTKTSPNTNSLELIGSKKIQVLNCVFHSSTSTSDIEVNSTNPEIKSCFFGTDRNYNNYNSISYKTNRIGIKVNTQAINTTIGGLLASEGNFFAHLSSYIYLDNDFDQIQILNNRFNSDLLGNMIFQKLSSQTDGTITIGKGVFKINDNKFYGNVNLVFLSLFSTNYTELSIKSEIKNNIFNKGKLLLQASNDPQLAFDPIIISNNTFKTDYSGSNLQLLQFITIEPNFALNYTNVELINNSFSSPNSNFTDYTGDVSLIKSTPEITNISVVQNLNQFKVTITGVTNSSSSINDRIDLYEQTELLSVYHLKPNNTITNNSS